MKRLALVLILIGICLITRHYLKDEPDSTPHYNEEQVIVSREDQVTQEHNRLEQEIEQNKFKRTELEAQQTSLKNKNNQYRLQQHALSGYLNPMQITEDEKPKQDGHINTDSPLKWGVISQSVGKPYPRWRYDANWMSQRHVYLSGNTPDERLQSFLTAYWQAHWYQPLTKIQETTRVDKYLITCITYADSSVGTNLTTPNNPGNVGNNERGNKAGYFTIEEWLTAIATTLNNKYLSEHQEVRKLNKTSSPWSPYVYSSWWSRTINVLNCLGIIVDPVNWVSGNYKVRI